MQEVPEPQVLSLHQEDPLEEEMTAQFSIIAWKIPWAEEPGELLVHGIIKEWNMTE